MLRRALFSLSLAAGLVIGCATATTTVDPPWPTGDAGTDAAVPGPDAGPTGASCKGDSDCTDASKKKCDPVSKTCQACVPTSDTCSSGNYCGKDGSGNYACLPGCKTDPECATLDAGVVDASADGGGTPTATPACCNHVCSNTAGDAKNCGKCGNTCGAGAGCCSSACQDTQSSLTNCGGCGSNCAPAHVTVPQCAAGACGYTSCSSPYSDCDGVKSNGCESDTTTDANNCGVCGKKCALGQQCAGGACVTCGSDEVSYNGHCYYLDGSNGVCDSGYARASEAVLAQVASLFQGKGYKHNISNFCCIWTSDVAANWGMTYPSGTCNKAGPIQAGEPSLGGANCNNVTYHSSTMQLTFCGK